MALKRQRRTLSVGAAGLATACGALTVVALDDRSPDVVKLGRGVAGVERPADAERHLRDGEASFYGGAFAGSLTASGERFDPERLTAAHRTLPMGSRLRVTNLANGESVVVRVNDRGPYHGRRVIDLSRAAAAEIGMLRQGKARVRIALLA